MSLISLRSCFGLAIAGAAALVTAQSGNERFFVNSESWQYSGSVTVYRTLEDALQEVNASRTLAWPARDGAMFVVRNCPGYYSDFNTFNTNWWAAMSDGGWNPNNQNLGFIQMYDENASNWLNQKAYWQKDLKTFTVNAKGKNATYPSSQNPEDYARLWNAGAPAGSGESTRGTFLKYDYSLTAVFDDEAVYDSDLAVWRNTAGSHPSSVSGHIKGIFRNESLLYPASNGYYVFDLVITSGHVIFDPLGRNAQITAGGQYNDPLLDEFGSALVKGRN